MRLGKFDFNQFYPENMNQVAISSLLLTVPTLSSGNMAAGVIALTAGWLYRQINTAWMRDNCLMASDLDNIKPTQTKHNDVTRALESFGILGVSLHETKRGAVLNRHYLKIPSGTKLGKIPADDIAREIGVQSIAINTNAGRGLISIDVPSEKRETVEFENLFNSDEWKNRQCKLPCIGGVDVEGNVFVFDLARAPHLIVGGTTGAGKSVFTNQLILSLMQSGADFRLMIGDGKGEDFAPFYGRSSKVLRADGVAAIATEVKSITNQVMWLAEEMDRRFSTGNKPYPIVYVMDELADVIMQQGKDRVIEKALTRIAQKGRSAGIHLILGTQYPSADILPPALRANIPSRAGLSVAKAYESEVVLGERGCEKLLGNGDCLFRLIGSNPIRIHGAFINDENLFSMVV